MEITDKDKAIVTWKDGDGNTKAIAFKQLYAALEKHQPVKSSSIYQNVYPNISIRDEFSRQDYEYYRPGEAGPYSSKAKIQASMDAYKEHGIFRNIVDLMGDFACQGIDLAHPIKKVENFYKHWFKLVNGKERSERIANLLCRTANVIVKRYTAKLSQKDVVKLQKTAASPDQSKLLKEYPVDKKEIPYKYTFLNPLSLEVLNQDFVPFIDPSNMVFGIKLDTQIVSKIQFPTNEIDKEWINKIPSEIVSLIKQGNKVIPLDSDKVSAIFYKKDDWDVWAEPMVSPVIKDLNMLRKMKLADLSAVDGIVSQIRIWKLGSLEHKILPTNAAINKLANILVNSVGGGILDLIWGPELELQETTTSLHQFLGETKYTPVLNSIFAGLGIPPLFSGSSNQGSFTNNFIAIKTLIERLEYIRDRLREFWEYEVKLIQKAMGFRKPASLVFDRTTLNDEASILQILLSLVDRNYLSIETVQEMVGSTPEIEKFRIKREQNEIKKGKLPPKASPFHNANYEIDAKKILIQQGRYFPGEELNIKESEIKEEIEEEENNDLDKKLKGEPGEGRPKNSKDKIKRKEKEVKPRTLANFDFAYLMSWASETQDFISNTITPVYLKSLNKKNLRQLTTEEFINFERFKFYVLMNLNPKEEITEERVFNLVRSNLSVPELVVKLLHKTLGKYTEKTGKEPSIDKIRFFQSTVFSLYNSESAA